LFIFIVFFCYYILIEVKLKMDDYKIVYSCVCGSVLHSYNGIRFHSNTKKHQLHRSFYPFVYDFDSRNYYYLNELTAHRI